MKKINDKETTDEVIQETRRIKEALAKSMDFDIDRILKDARLRQGKSGRKILSPPLRRKIRDSQPGFLRHFNGGKIISLR